MRNRTLLLALGLSLVALGALAQQPSASHVKAIEDLFQVMDMKATLNQSIDVVLKSQIDANPQLKPLEDVMRRFLAKYMSFESLKPGMVSLYAEAFTEPEVRELVAFYRTPLGHKMVTRMPLLLQKGAALGQKAVQDHLPELQEEIAKKMQEGNTSGKP